MKEGFYVKVVKIPVFIDCAGQENELVDDEFERGQFHDTCDNIIVIPKEALTEDYETEWHEVVLK
jgi:hypothetical protein